MVSPELVLLSDHYTGVTELSAFKATWQNLLLLVTLCSLTVSSSQSMSWRKLWWRGCSADWPGCWELGTDT